MVMVSGTAGAGARGGTGTGAGADAGAGAGAGAGRYGAEAAGCAGTTGTRTTGGRAGATGAGAAAGRAGEAARSEDGRRSLLTGAVEVAEVEDGGRADVVEGADDARPACCTEGATGPAAVAVAVPSDSHAAPAPAENPMRARPARATSGMDRASGGRIEIISAPPRIACKGALRAGGCRAPRLMPREH